MENIRMKRFVEMRDVKRMSKLIEELKEIEQIVNDDIFFKKRSMLNAIEETMNSMLTAKIKTGSFFGGILFPKNGPEQIKQEASIQKNEFSIDDHESTMRDTKNSLMINSNRKTNKS